MEKHCNPMCRNSFQIEHSSSLCSTRLALHPGSWVTRLAQGIVKFLTIEMHCDPTTRNTNYLTALHFAVVNGHLDIIHFFISDQNCDPILISQHGETLLHYVAQCGHLYIVKYLIDEQG